MGGEKPLLGSLVLPALGSPPHGRGKEIWNEFFRDQNGITPAWAGKSFNVAFFCVALKDHPRMGGEKLLKLHGEV